MAEFALGVLSGLIASLFIWVYKVYIAPPAIKFGEKLIRRNYDDGSVGYNYIYKNSGKRRLIDISVKEIIKIPGLKEHNKKLYQVINFDSAHHERLLIEPNKPISNRLNLNIASIIKNKPLFLRAMNDLGTIESISIDYMFNLSPDTVIIIYILGNDELTGVRKVFESPSYRISAVSSGVFDRESFSVIEKISLEDTTKKNIQSINTFAIEPSEPVDCLSSADELSMNEPK